MVAGEHLQARDHPHHIPLERAGQRLVEVTEVERELAFRCRPQPEVEDVSVAAQLHHQAAIGPRGEVGGHHGGGTAVVIPWRGRHTAVAYGHQVGRPHGVLSEHGNEGVMATPVAVPRTRIRARQSFPRGAPQRPTLDEGRTLRARLNPKGAFPFHGGTVVNLTDSDAGSNSPGPTSRPTRRRCPTSPRTSDPTSRLDHHPDAIDMPIGARRVVALIVVRSRHSEGVGSSPPARL